MGFHPFLPSITSNEATFLYKPLQQLFQNAQRMMELLATPYWLRVEAWLLLGPLHFEGWRWATSVRSQGLCLTLLSGPSWRCSGTIYYAGNHILKVSLNPIFGLWLWATLNLPPGPASLCASRGQLSFKNPRQRFPANSDHMLHNDLTCSTVVYRIEFQSFFPGFSGPKLHRSWLLPLSYNSDDVYQ